MTRKASKKADPGKIAADRAVAFINNLTHTKGRWAGQKFQLRGWQENGIIRPLFGTLRPDGLRQYRTLLAMLPRKNGKSEIMAGIALYLLLGESEMGGEIYSCAADRGQASLVFDVAAAMIRNDPELSSMTKIVDSTKRIVNPKTGSFYRAISSEAYSKHGFNASAILYDELHTAPDRELWTVLTSSMGTRTQPLVCGISTAGWNPNSLCYELYDYGKKVRDGIISDPTFLPVLYEAPQDADWRDEEVWKACNPALGDFLSIEDMRRACAEAMELPIRQNAFRRLRLNQWTEVGERWFDAEVWQACGAAVKLEDFEEEGCTVGVDLGGSTSMCAVAVIFKDHSGGVYVHMKYYTHETDLRKRSDRDHGDYEAWRDLGFLTVTPGQTVDYEYIERDILEIHRRFGITEICFDRWGAVPLTTRLEKHHGLTCVGVGQGFASMAAPCQELERLVVSRQLRHGNNPILQWNATNTQLEIDAAGNKKPNKAKSTGRIDGISALLTALNRLIRTDDTGSFIDNYEDEPIVVDTRWSEET